MNVVFSTDGIMSIHPRDETEYYLLKRFAEDKCRHILSDMPVMGGLDLEVAPGIHLKF
jgi:hypothetical protein